MERARSIISFLALVGSLLASSWLLLGCQVDPERASTGDAAAQQRVHFGKPLQGLPRTPLSDIVDRPEQYGERTIAVEGHVARACTRKGCWMEITAAPGNTSPACRVTFEDYAFFVPKDAPGAWARLEGKVVTSRIEPSHVEHLESEGAHFASKNADGSALEVQIVATGVELQRHAKTEKKL